MVPVDTDVERRRVALHIAAAERRARAAKPHRDAVIGTVRRLLLDELVHYRRSGHFPRNPGTRPFAPVFVDEVGTRCAVAHLLEASGEGELVRRIAHERNHAFVSELVDEPRLRAWLAAAGLTAAEAAAIQPSYCLRPFSDALRAHDFYAPARAVLDGTIVSIAGDVTAEMRIDTIRGTTSEYVVGEMIETVGPGPQPVVGQHRLVPIPPVSPTPVSFAYDGMMLSDTSVPLTVEQYVAAVTSTDCEGTLHSFDARWSDHPPCPDGPAQSCAVSPSGDVTTIGILVALLAYRRLRRA